MKIFIWAHSIMGGGDIYVVLAEDEESARKVIRSDKNFFENFGEPDKNYSLEEISIDSPKLVKYFSYFE